MHKNYEGNNSFIEIYISLLAKEKKAELLYGKSLVFS